LDLGFFQDLADVGSVMDGWPSLGTYLYFTLGETPAPVDALYLIPGPTPPTPPAPLPGSILLTGTGLLVLALARSRRRS
jgi:hypothetical protein